jgi:hypothetical protein
LFFKELDLARAVEQKNPIQCLKLIAHFGYFKKYFALAFIGLLCHFDELGFE